MILSNAIKVRHKYTIFGSKIFKVFTVYFQCIYGLFMAIYIYFYLLDWVIMYCGIDFMQR